MALIKTVSVDELGHQITWIREFMIDRSSQPKTFSELTKIFNSCWETFEPDPSDDKRVLTLQEIISSGKWHGCIDIQVVNGIAKEGIHRGIAVIRCTELGVDTLKLPEIHFVDHPV